MSLIDSQGRVFGRINLIDAAVAAFLLLLIPLAYGTALLFRPPTPRIDSVTSSEITLAERRLGHGPLLSAKFKVRGTGFNPMLRAFIGETPSMGFVFENPNSADVLVGAIQPGDYDLILMDGVHEVARAPVSIEGGGVRSTILAVGWMTGLAADASDALQVGFAFPDSDPTFEIVALGPPQPGHQRLNLGGHAVDLPRDGVVDREAVLRLRCDPARGDSPCGLGDRGVGPVTLAFPGPTGPLTFALAELLPEQPAVTAEARVRVSSIPGLPFPAVGDREAYLDQRAAVVTGVQPEPGGAILTVTLGLDASREGWRYRGRLLRPGAPFPFVAADYEIAGQVVSVTVPEAGRD